MLFVTIACGAVSGFHGLVSSGTTSKQIQRESEARVIGYGGMVGEGCLALVATLAVTAGFATREDWHSHYASWGAANGLGAKIGAFVNGSTVFLEGVGIPAAIGSVVVAVLVISFAATSLDTATRIQRFVVQELADVYNITPLKNRYVAGLVAVGTAGLLVIVGNGGLMLWPLFGAGNQLLAGLTLVVVSIWLAREGKNYWVTLAPALFLGAMTSIAMVYNLKTFHSDENWLLLTLSGILVALEMWIVLEGVAAFRARPAREAAS
jgi:carbon starvation protein